MTLKGSLVYPPVELGFGTSGLRGLVTDMTDLECYINILGFLEFLYQIKDIKADQTVFIGGDLRQSTPQIMAVAAKACKAAGLNYVNCGLIPTPALAYYASLQNSPCIMVTGSHIPSDRNGIKFYKTVGEVLKADEEPIHACVAAVRQKIYQQAAQNSEFSSKGMFVLQPAISDPITQAARAYSKRYTDFFDNSSLAGKQIVFYQHSAVGRELIPDILAKLGASIVLVEPSDTFVSIDTENVTAEYKQKFTTFAKQYPEAFAIVSTDGDSDRPFVIDETGTFHRGDVLGVVVADYLEATFAAVPISSNDAVDVFCQQKKMELKHTKIGSPFVVEAMESAEVSGLRCGWEVNGGFLTGSDITKDGRLLKALPTRDAALPIIAALLAAARSNIKVSELFKALPQRFTGGSLIDNVQPAKIAHFKLLCNQPAKMEELVTKLFSSTTIGSVKNIDLTDGLRLVFESTDVIHLRPSGNAPQFRVYTNSSSQENADVLAHESVKMDGYIEKLIEAL